MLKSIFIVLCFATSLSAQEVTWREIPAPTSQMKPRGVQAIGKLLFIRSQNTDNTEDLYVSGNEGATWSLCSFPQPIREIGEIVQTKDGALHLVASAVGKWLWSLYDADADGVQWRASTLLEPSAYQVHLLFDTSLVILRSMTLNRVTPTGLDSFWTFLPTDNCDKWYSVPAASHRVFSAIASCESIEGAYPGHYVGKLKMRPSVLGMSSMPTNLVANDRIAIFFNDYQLVIDGITPRYEYLPHKLGKIVDAAIAGDWFYLATPQQLLTLRRDSLARATTLGAVPVEPLSLAALDTLLVIASKARLFLSSRVTSSVAAIADATPGFVYDHSKKVIRLRVQEEVHRELQLIGAASGIAYLFPLDPSTVEIYVANVPSGAYFWRLRSGATTHYGKLIIY